MSLYGEYTKTSETHIVHIAAEDGVPVCTHLECPPACNKLSNSKCPKYAFEHDPGGEAEFFPGVGVWRFEAVFTGTWTDHGMEHDMEYQNITQIDHDCKHLDINGECDGCSDCESAANRYLDMEYQNITQLQDYGGQL